MIRIKGLIAGVLALAAAMSWGQEPKYIFYFIGDGMGMGPAMAAANYSRTVLGSEDMPLMMTFPVCSQVTTWSASSPVTDSAAAGTALATGHKTNNGMVGMTPDTVAVRSVADILHEAGYGVGLVTNVAADDATPAAFYAHVPKRYMAREIDLQLAGSGVDFLAGASLRGLRDNEGESTGVLELFADRGVHYAEGLEALGKTDGARRIVLVDADPYNDSNVGYMIDARDDMPTLAEFTMAGLSHLEKVSPERFFMMVEGGNIDHALHGNDPLAAIGEIYNFNNALAVARNFMEAHPDETLIVVTADHDTGGMSVGNNANGFEAHFDLLKSQRMSKAAFSDLCKEMMEAEGGAEWDEMRNILTDNLGFWNEIALDEKETQELADIFDQVFVLRSGADEKTLYNDFNAFATKVYGILSQKAAVGWTSTHHTGGFVPLYAAGVGSDLFSRVLDNTEIMGIILGMVGANR